MNTEHMSEALVLLGLLSAIPAVSVFVLGHQIRLHRIRRSREGVSSIVFWSIFTASSLVITLIHAEAFRSSGREHYAYTSILAHIFAFLPAYVMKKVAYGITPENKN